MLYNFSWDDLIPIFAIGALLISAIYHSNLFYFNRTKLLGSYSLYLWVSLLFTLLATGTLNSKVDKMPLIPYIICSSTLWSSYLVYLNFILATLKSESSSSTFIKYTRRNWAIFPLCILVHSAKYIFPSQFEDIFNLITLIFDGSILLSSIFILFTLYQQKRDIFNLYIIRGAVCLIFFNIFSAITLFYDGYLFALTTLSYICIGYFCQIIFFSLAISYKIKQDYNDKLEALNIAGLQTLALEAEKKKASEILLQHDYNIQNERIKAISEQRGEIGRKLHDDLSGSLISLRYLISDYKRKAQTEIEKKCFGEIEMEVESIYNQTRNYSHQLSSSEKFVEDKLSYNLPNYLKKIEKQFFESELFKVYTDFDDYEVSTILSATQTQHIYFWLKECFVNTIKHAQAEKISVTIKFTNADCTVTFTDDGKGFDMQKNNEGVGLKSLKTRANDLNGSFEMKSSDAGTIMILNFGVN